jgi:flagellar biosynthesis protein FlhF
MTVKSFFAGSVEEAIAMARREWGPEAMLVNSRRTPEESRHLGEYEVVFATRTASAVTPTESLDPSEGDRISAEIYELKRQLESMRVSLTKSAFAPEQWLGRPPALAEAYALLTSNDVSPQLAREIVLGAQSRSHGVVDGPAWRQALSREVTSHVLVDALPSSGDCPPRVLALVGPPGVGKTTTLVKLAVMLGLAKRRPVLLLSLDTYRIAAADQLRSYAAILGVGIQILETTSALTQVLEEHRGKGLILIDTPGWAFADWEQSAELARFLSTREDIDRQLVLSCSTKPADLTRVIDHYEVFHPQHLLFTRLDETASLGAVLNEAARTQKPLSFFTTGQRIPEDLEAATHQRLLRVILGDCSEAALQAA